MNWLQRYRANQDIAFAKLLDDQEAEKISMDRAKADILRILGKESYDRVMGI